jgi:hypothetical protein
MTPLSTFLLPIKERKKLLKDEKRRTYVRNNREILNERNRLWKRKKTAFQTRQAD